MVDVTKDVEIKILFEEEKRARMDNEATKSTQLCIKIVNSITNYSVELFIRETRLC